MEIVNTNFIPGRTKSHAETLKANYFLKLRMLEKYGYTGLLSKKGYLKENIESHRATLSIERDESGRFPMAQLFGGYLGVSNPSTTTKEHLLSSMSKFCELGSADVERINAMKKNEKLAFKGKDGLDYLLVRGKITFNWSERLNEHIESINKDPTSHPDYEFNIYKKALPGPHSRAIGKALNSHFVTLGATEAHFSISRHLKENGSIYVVEGTLYRHGYHLYPEIRLENSVPPIFSQNNFVAIISASKETDSDAKALFDHLKSISPAGNLVCSLHEQSPQKKPGMHLKKLVKLVKGELVKLSDQITTLQKVIDGKDRMISEIEKILFENVDANKPLVARLETLVARIKKEKQDYTNELNGAYNEINGYKAQIKELVHQKSEAHKKSTANENAATNLATILSDIRKSALKKKIQGPTIDAIIKSVDNAKEQHGEFFPKEG